MIHIVGAKTIQGNSMELPCQGKKEQQINAAGLTIFPGLIDPHVHFRTPGMEHKEDWRTASLASLHGGYTTVFDMPNTIPPTVTAELLREKKALIDAQLADAGIPLRYELYFGADKNHLSEIHKIRDDVVGIKVFMGCSTGNLVIDDDESLHAVFAIAATQNLIVAVHAEDEEMIKSRKREFADSARQYCDHSRIRDVDVAARAVEKAISLVEIYGTRLYLLHASSKDEIALVRQAKKAGLPVYAETTPHHLFLDERAYASLHGKAVVNPPLRSEENRLALWDAVRDGTIDTIGSDHAPHLESEKALPYGQCPSGMPGVETTLPLLLTAFHDGLISLERIISLTSERPREIFGLSPNDDKVLVDMDLVKTVNAKNLKTKCGWSSFAGMALRGWPKYVVMRDQFFDLSV
jgi:dihydroorotase